MRFTPLIFVASFLAALTAADAAPEPTLAARQGKAAASSFAIELDSYISGLKTDSAYQSAQSRLDNPADQSSLDAWFSDVSSVFLANTPFKTNFLDPLPTEVRSVFSSLVVAEVSIASKAGFNLPAPGQTKTANAASPQQTAVIAAAGAVAGLLGAIAAL